ncbi:MAG: septal ring lytic transglycosylase RlpA family protein [Candidatus Midichloria sp.]|nr:septal ring lytic transglycosylase RlpA family protein [Candidatus Midichloria sp.]
MQKLSMLAVGKGSWYWTSFHGRLTASRAVFNKNLYSQPNRSLSFGSSIKVTNLQNGKQAVLIVNDKGPVPKDRIRTSC